MSSGPRTEISLVPSPLAYDSPGFSFEVGVAEPASLGETNPEPALGTEDKPLQESGPVVVDASPVVVKAHVVRKSLWCVARDVVFTDKKAGRKSLWQVTRMALRHQHSLRGLLTLGNLGPKRPSTLVDMAQAQSAIDLGIPWPECVQIASWMLVQTIGLACILGVRNG